MFSAEPVFLNKVVADQLRNRHRMVVHQKEQYYHSSPKDAHQNHTNQQLRLRRSTDIQTHDNRIVKRVTDDESEFVSNSGVYVESAELQSHDQLRHRITRRHAENKNKNFNIDESDGMPLHRDDMKYFGNEESSDEEFKNVYIKPWTDIGVELDNDLSTFIRLEDLEEEPEVQQSLQ